MLSLEGILSAGSTIDASVDWWFRKATINWCNADLEYGGENGEDPEIDGHPVEDAIYKALDPDGSRANYNDPRDIVCAYPEIPDGGDITNARILINPARIFRRIIAAYNEAHRSDSLRECFPVAEIEECRWIEGIDTIQRDETAAEYINRVLCKNAVTYTFNGSDDFNSQVAGFQYFVDGAGHHFRRLEYKESNDTNTISLHFGTQNSRVISFSAANVGALAMAGFHEDENYGEILSGSTSLNLMLSEFITTGAEHFSKDTKITNTIDSLDAATDSNYFSDMLSANKLDITNIKSSSTASSLSAEYTEEYRKLKDLPFEAQISVWGDYSNDIKPGKFINLLTYDTQGHEHYTSGLYYITQVVDDVSAEGYIQTATLIKNTAFGSSGSIDADDNTGSNKVDSPGETTVGIVNYTVPQRINKSTSLEKERVKNANNTFSSLANSSSAPIRPIN